MHPYSPFRAFVHLLLSGGGIARFILLLHPLDPLQAADMPSGASVTPEVCPYRYNCPAGYSFSFDDGNEDHLTIAVPLLEKYGFRGTFFIIAGRVGVKNVRPKEKSEADVSKLTWDQIKEMQQRGHEIANHGMTHTSGFLLNTDGQIAEATGAQTVLEKKLGVKPVTFAFPGNNITPEYLDIVLRTHIAARLKSLSYGGSDFTVEKANGHIDTLIDKGGDNVAMIHAITPGQGHKPFNDVAIFEEHLKYVHARRDQVWVDTFANVSKYRLNREGSVLKILEQTSNTLRFTLAPKSGAETFDIPLTVKLSGATDTVSASANGKELPLIWKNGAVLVEIRPGPDEVSIRLQ